MEAVIFIGIQATGKTTFYHEYFASTHVHVSLDLLKTRRREERLLEDCIRDRLPFVVDNTNVLVAERAKTIAMARAAGYAVTGYYFQSRLKDALLRNEQRAGKARIPDRGVLARYHALQPPRYAEGFERLYLVTIDPQERFIIQQWHESEMR